MDRESMMRLAAASMTDLASYILCGVVDGYKPLPSTVRSASAYRSLTTVWSSVVFGARPSVDMVPGLAEIRLRGDDLVAAIAGRVADNLDVRAELDAYEQDAEERRVSA